MLPPVSASHDGLTSELKSELNEDIIATLFQHLPWRSTALHLMQTCHFLYTTGIPHLLSYPVGFTSNEYWLYPDATRVRKMSSFIAFIFAEPQPGHRARHIRDLTICDDDALSDEIFSQLLEIVRRATRLHTFTSIGKGNKHITAMIEILIGNENVKVIGYSVDMTTADILRQWRARLEVVHLDLSQIDDTPGNLYHDPTWMLQPFSATLRELELSGHNYRLESALTLPSVKKLTLNGGMRIQDVARAYPNLKHIEVSFDMDWYWEYRAEEYREENWAGNRIGCWELLDVVDGSVEDVYALGLPCKIQRLVLYADEHGGEEETDRMAVNLRAMMRTMLDLAKPSQISLNAFVNYPGEPESEIIREIYGRETTGATENGPAQQIEITYDFQNPRWKTGFILDTYSDIFCRLGPLSSIKIAISDYIQWDIAVVGHDQTAPTACDLPEMFVESSPSASDIGIVLAVRVAQRIPPFKKLELKFRHERAHTWEPVIDEQGQMLKLRCLSSRGTFEIVVPQDDTPSPVQS